MKKKNLDEEKNLLNRQKLILKITETEKRCRIVTDRNRTIAVTPKEVVATDHTLQTAFVAEVNFTPELSALKQDLPRLTCCMTHYSEEPNDSPHTCKAGWPGQLFLLKFSNTPSATQIKIIALALSFLLVLAYCAPLATVIHSQRLKKFKH